MPLPAVLLSADLAAAAMLAGTGARADWATSARVAGCWSFGSGSPANTSQPGAAMGGVARRPGAVASWGSLAVPGTAFRVDPRRAALTSEGGLGAPPRQDPHRATGGELHAAWHHVR